MEEQTRRWVSGFCFRQGGSIQSPMATTRLAESGSYNPQNAIANRVSAEGGCIKTPSPIECPPKVDVSRWREIEKIK